MQTIENAKNAYAEIVRLMPDIARKGQNEYYSGKDEDLGPAIAELGTGRHIVIKPVMLNCYKDRNTENVHPLIDGSVSIASRIMSPGYTVIKRHFDEKPLNLTKCNKETFEEQINTQVALFREYLKKAEVEELIYAPPILDVSLRCGATEVKKPESKDFLISYT